MSFYTVALPMEVPAIEIGEIIRHSNATLHKVKFSSPGKKNKGELGSTNRMKRILYLTGEKVDFSSLLTRYVKRVSHNW